MRRMISTACMAVPFLISSACGLGEQRFYNVSLPDGHVIVACMETEDRPCISPQQEGQSDSGEERRDAGAVCQSVGGCP
jgi:hypothetical protein